MRGKDLLECMEWIDDALIQEALNPPAVPRRKNTVVRWGMAAACTVVVGVSAAALWSHQNLENAPIEHMEIAGDSAAAQNALPESATAAGNAPEHAPAQTEQTQGAKADRSILAGGVESAERSSELDTSAVKDNSAELSEIPASVQSAMEEYTIVRSYCGEESDVTEDSAFQKHSTADDSAPKRGTVLCAQELQEAVKYYGEQELRSEYMVHAYEVVIVLFGDAAADDGSKTLYQELQDPELMEQEYLRLSEMGYDVRLSEEFQLTGIFTQKELDAFPAAQEYGYLFHFIED